MPAVINYDLGQQGWAIFVDASPGYLLKADLVNAHRGDLGGLFMLVATELRSRPHSLTEEQADDVYRALNDESKKFPMNLALHRRGEPRVQEPPLPDSYSTAADVRSKAVKFRLSAMPPELAPRSRRVVRPGDA